MATRGKDERVALLMHQKDGDHHQIFEADGGRLLFYIENKVFDIIQVVQINLSDTSFESLDLQVLGERRQFHHQEGDHHWILEADGGHLLFYIKNKVFNTTRLLEINL